MLQALIQVLLYALVAGVSPLAFAATIAVLHAGRPKAIAFAVAFVAAQLLTCSLFVAVGGSVTGSSRTRYPGVQVVLEVALAVALVWLAGRVRRRPPSQGEVVSGRAQRLAARLERLGFLTTIGAGLVLGVGVPKRLVLAALAAAAIGTSGLRGSGQAALVITFTAVATALVWGPVVLFVPFGDRTVALMKRAEAEVRRRQPQVTVNALLVLAGIFALDACAILLTHFA